MRISDWSSDVCSSDLSHELHDVSRVLGVRYVVQGDVRVSGSGLHINVALADAVEGRELWADSFHRKLEHVFEAQEEYTALVVGAISKEVEQAERQPDLPDTPVSLDAGSATHQGSWHL